MEKKERYYKVSEQELKKHKVFDKIEKDIIVDAITINQVLDFVNLNTDVSHAEQLQSEEIQNKLIEEILQKPSNKIPNDFKEFVNIEAFYIANSLLNKKGVEK